MRTGNYFLWAQEMVIYWSASSQFEENVEVGGCAMRRLLHRARRAGGCRRVAGWSWRVWMIIPYLSHCLAISSKAEMLLRLRIMLMASSAPCNMNMKLPLSLSLLLHDVGLHHEVVLPRRLAAEPRETMYLRLFSVVRPWELWRIECCLPAGKGIVKSSPELMR
jgi:hypothetical protein